MTTLLQSYIFQFNDHFLALFCPPPPSTPKPFFFILFSLVDTRRFASSILAALELEFQCTSLSEISVTAINFRRGTFWSCRPNDQISFLRVIKLAKVRFKIFCYFIVGPAVDERNDQRVNYCIYKSLWIVKVCNSEIANFTEELKNKMSYSSVSFSCVVVRERNGKFLRN